MAGSVIIVSATWTPDGADLVKRGFSLVVHDSDSHQAAPLRDGGAKVVASPEQVAAAAEPRSSWLGRPRSRESVIAGERAS